MTLAIARVGGLDQGLQHVERRGLDAVAEQELMCGIFSIAGTRHIKNGKWASTATPLLRALSVMKPIPSDQGYALDPKGKEERIKDLMFWPNGSPGR